MGDRDDIPLDEPVGESLRGHHAQFARRFGRALTYVPEVATFSAVTASPDGWADLARLLGRGELADMFSSPAEPPADWEPVFTLQARQMVGPARTAPDADAGVVELGPTCSPSRNGPGPDRSGPAPERLRPPGWTEISALCTAPEARGQGHAARLIRALIARITARGERPFLHVTETNTSALALYEHLGFQTRKPVTFRGYCTP